jgi:hypothetical protein
MIYKHALEVAGSGYDIYDGKCLGRFQKGSDEFSVGNAGTSGGVARPPNVGQIKTTYWHVGTERPTGIFMSEAGSLSPRIPTRPKPAVTLRRK